MNIIFCLEYNNKMNPENDKYPDVEQNVWVGGWEEESEH